MGDKLYKVAISIILILSAIVLLFLSINSFLHYVYLNVETGSLELRNHDLLSLITLVAFVTMLYLVVKYVLLKVSDTALFVVMSLIMVAAGIFIIINCVPAVRADSMMVYDYVERFNQGDYTGIEDGRYFSWNPALLGLLTYERIIGAATMNLRVFYTFELLWYLLIQFFSWKIARRVTADELVIKLTVLLSFVFFPILFYILQVYGMLLGFALALASLYMLLLSIQTAGRKSFIYSLIAALLIGFACLIKQQYQIMMIAMVIICILEFVRNKRVIMIITAVIMPVVTICFSTILFESYRNASGYDMGTGEPISLYIAMGLQDNENPLSNGTYNGYNFDTYSESNFDEELSSKLGKEYIKERLSYFSQHPEQMMKFFYNKLTGTWDEPTFASIANGCSAMWGETPEELFLGSLYDGDHLYHAYVIFMSIFVFLIYFAALANLLIRIRQRYKWDVLDVFPYLYFLGGFAYHLISESSARYVYIYVYVLIPALADLAIKLLKNGIRN